MLVSSTLNRPLRSAGASDARKTLARHGKSFSWATRIFARETAADVATLYAFCRQVDDIADHSDPELARQRLAGISADLKAGYSRVAAIDAFIHLSRRHRIDPRVPTLLVDTLRLDTGPVRMEQWDHLIRYAYGVASTVGLMMCPIMGVTNRAALPFAIDLGIGMQLTNIARDVVEDARRDRIYIPAEMLDGEITAAQIVSDPGVVPTVTRARRDLLERAGDYYRSAHLGMRYIPLRPRLAVKTAARLYEAIGGRILAGSTPWGERAFVNRRQKVVETAAAVTGLLFDPPYRSTGKDPVHNPYLHRAIRSLPGADGRSG